MEPSEFDKFADEYAATMRNTTLLGNEDTDYFARYKVEALARETAHVSAPLAVLDFGAGVGTSVRHFNRVFADVRLTCVDVSERSLAIGAEEHGSASNFVRFDGARLPFREASFDAVFIACVLHHIPHDRHPALFSQLFSSLKPGGLCMVFEHNPFNPLTRRVVRDCPFDENAVLLNPAQLQHNLAAVGFDCELRYRLFFPQALRALRPLERWLEWLPAGAQYSVRAIRPPG